MWLNFIFWAWIMDDLGNAKQTSILQPVFNFFDFSPFSLQWLLTYCVFGNYLGFLRLCSAASYFPSIWNELIWNWEPCVTLSDSDLLYLLVFICSTKGIWFSVLELYCCLWSCSHNALDNSIFNVVFSIFNSGYSLGYWYLF